MKRIYESDNESLHKMEFIDEEGNLHSDFERITSELLEMDYIETENDKNIFFLTTEGYDFVEELKGLGRREIHERKETQTKYVTELINEFGVKKVKKYIFISLILFGIFVSIYKYFSLNKLETNNPEIEVILIDEMMNDVKKQIQKKVDSLKKVKNETEMSTPNVK